MTEDRIEKPNGAAQQVECDSNRMLIVDDEDGILRLFKMLLSMSFPGFQIDTANSGAAALELFSKDHHRLLIMDLYMPVMDGVTAFHKMHELCGSRKWQMPQVIFCTGFVPPDTLKRILANNPQCCLLTKPVSPDTILQVVKSRLI